MRIFLSGNEDIARKHLPIAQAKVGEFVARTEKSGLLQNSFAFCFDDTGVEVVAQYAFGQVQMQVSAPFQPMIDLVPDEEEIPVPIPGTFYIETGSGYFWVHVRTNEEGQRVVVLEPFEAMKASDDIFSQEFVYPAMGHRTPGMLSGSFGLASNRYVVSQASGVFVGEGVEKGTIKMPPVGSADARLNVESNDITSGKFCVIENTNGKSCFFKIISVSADDDGEIIVDVKHGDVDMLSEGENGGINTALLNSAPCWIHRKCLGSYFSPNKTIGFHTDIGTDDDFFGNLMAIPGALQDKLDNGGDYGSFFNHAPELFRIASLAAAPISFSDTSITLLLVSPTMIKSLGGNETHCWGGYGQTQSNAGCIDIQQDFPTTVISPRFCKVTYYFQSGGVSVIDIDGPGDASGGSVTIYLNSWDDSFSASLIVESEITCGPEYYINDAETKPVSDPCGWTDDGTGACSVDAGAIVAVEKEVPKEQRYFQHFANGFEENLKVSRKVDFRFNDQSYIASPSSRGKNFYFLFDGWWHIGFAVMYLTNPVVTNQCGLCAFPPYSQAPGELVMFSVGGSVESGFDQQWLAENASEYVNENLSIVFPLAVQSIYWPPNGANVTILSFIAKVNENLKAPHESVPLVGGITYPAPDVDGETIKCEYTLVSAPCICDGGFSFDTPQHGCGSYISTTGGRACIQGGCGPYSWSVSGGSLVDFDGVNHGSSVSNTDITSFLISGSGYACSASVQVTDACGETIELTAEDPGGQRAVYGPGYLWQGNSATYAHNMGSSATYTGGMTMVSHDANSAVLQMPTGQTEPVTIRWDGPCGWFAEMSVVPGYCDCETVGQIAWACYPSWCSWLTVFGGQLGVVGGCGPLNWSMSGGRFVVGETDYGTSISNTNIRYVTISVDSPNCEVSVSVTDVECGTTITKEAERDTGGTITGPEVLAAGSSAWYHHNIPSASYSGELTLAQQKNSAVLLTMPETATDTKTFSLEGDCGLFAEKSVEPLYCKCSTSSMAWGEYSSDVVLGGMAQMYFSGGCAPFTWFGNGVSFVDSGGNSIPFEARKTMNSLYVKSTDECEGSVSVRDMCNNELSRSKSISGTTGTVVGPATLEPGETATYYHDLGATAEYTGTLTVVQQSSGAAVLLIPDGATGIYTASWTASCGRSATLMVLAVTGCDFGADPASDAFPGVGGYVQAGDHVYQLGASVNEGYSEQYFPAGQWEIIAGPYVRHWRGQKIVDGVNKSYADHHPMGLIC